METAWLDQYLDAWDIHLSGGEDVANKMIEASTPDIRYEDLNMLYNSMPGFTGPEGLRTLCEAREEFIDTHMGVQTKQVSDDGRRWAIEWEMRGTRASTGGSFAVKGASIGTLAEDGRVSSHLDYWNPSHWT